MCKTGKFLVLVLVLMVVSTGLFAGGGGQQQQKGVEIKHTLTFATVHASFYHYPVFVAREKGWFKEAGLEVKELSFTNGPVMVEALNNWDLGQSGIGGQLPAVINHNAVLIGPLCTDDGTQRLFVRNNSPILAAGTGKNKLSPKIYGTAETWKGKKIIYNAGAVLHFFLIRVLEGFGLTIDDISSLIMDPATAGSAFRAGEGDVVAITGSGGALAFIVDPNFTSVAEGPWFTTGLMGATYANRNSYNNPAKREAMKVMLKVFYNTVDWIYKPANFNEAVELMMKFGDEMGTPMDRRMAEFYLKMDRFYTPAEAVEMMTTKAAGKTWSEFENRIINVLEFFINAGSRKKGDVELFLGHQDLSLYQELARERK